MNESKEKEDLKIGNQKGYENVGRSSKKFKFVYY